MNSNAADSTLAWGVYIPPNDKHYGYVRVIDRKTKSFPCGYVRSTARHKRCHDEMSKGDGAESTSDAIYSDYGVKETSDNIIPEECLHPEEAIFLCTRGLLRIESFPSNDNISIEPRVDATMTTQELMNIMLPQCSISMTTYLAYAHLREQGYNLMRYTSSRFSLLLDMEASKNQSRRDEGVPSHQHNISPHDELEVLPSDKPEEISISHIGGKRKSIKQLYKDDVASAPPPCVTCTSDSNETNVNLSYLAYNPNAKFKRTDPGLPDFGVAIMQYYSHGERGPTFDDISSLHSLCQASNKEDIELPLRIMTVSDGGAVIAFGVNSGDVPCINQ